MKIAIFPGSFDPFHEGHLNIINKALLLFDKIYVVVTKNWNKANQGDINKRVQVVKQKLSGIDKITVITNTDDLTYKVAKKLKADFIIRGLRNNEDLKYELEMSYANKQYNPNLETVFFISDYGLEKISSTLKKEIEMIENIHKK